MVGCDLKVPFTFLEKDAMSQLQGMLLKLKLEPFTSEERVYSRSTYYGSMNPLPYISKPHPDNQTKKL